MAERIIAILLLGCFYFFEVWTIVHGAEIPSPLATVKETVERLEKIVKDPKLAGEVKKHAREEEIRKLILERWDMEHMARSALGRHWKARTDSERVEYVKAFSFYIDVQYRKMIFDTVQFVNSDGIRFLKERLDGEFAEVDLVIDYSPEDIKATFRLHLVDGHWKAHDVIVEGISQVQNLRSQFDRVITKSSFAELLRILRSKS